MKGDHEHHKHHHPKEQAEKRVDDIEQQLEEKTLHGHNKAMHSDTRHHPPATSTPVTNRQSAANTSRVWFA